MDITHVSAHLPVLSHLLPIFYSGCGKIWSMEGELTWNQENFEMSPVSSGRLRPFEMSRRRILNEHNHRMGCRAIGDAA